MPPKASARTTTDGAPAKPMSIEELILALPSTQPEKVATLTLAKKSILRLPAQLAFLKALRRLDLSHNALSDVTPLSKIPTLSQLKLANNNLQDLSPLAPLVGLVVLDVGHNQLTSLAGIERMRGLKAIIAPDNRLQDLTAFEKLSDSGAAPETIVVSRNPLRSVDAVAPLALFAPTLRKLSASHCELTAVPTFDMPLLNELRLSGNALTEFPEGTAFRSLKILDVASNQFDTLASMTKFSFFIDQLSIHGNPVAAADDEADARLLRRMVARLFKNVTVLDGKKFDRTEALRSRRGAIDVDDDVPAEGSAAVAGGQQQPQQTKLAPAEEADAKDVVYEGSVPEETAPAQRVYVRARKTHRRENAPVAAAESKGRPGAASPDDSRRLDAKPPQAPIRADPTPTKESVLQSLAQSSDPLASAGGW